MNPHHKSPLEWLVTFTITLLACSIALAWAWRLLRPLMPLLLAIVIVYLILKIVNKRRNEW
jgi:CHASE2 domain-containing sensor protein